MSSSFCVVFLFSYLSLAFSQSVTVETEARAIADINAFIANNTNTGNQPEINNPAAKLVRLAFHDCPGGCDGCLNFENPENNGLMETYTIINGIFDRNGYAAEGMSRADFVALAGVIAIEAASMRQDCRMMPPNSTCPLVPTMTLKYGRRDCQTSPRTDDIEPFPVAHGDLSHVLMYFRDNMNMSTRETVAIIGAHSLGTTRLQNSGFRGPWAPPTDRFDNGFYRILFGGGNARWMQEEVNDTRSSVFPDSRYQWTRPGPGNGGPGPGNGGGPVIMLNSDMALLRDIDPDSDGRESNASCRMNSNNCEESMLTFNMVREFAMNNSAFIEAFGPAFQKLIETGYHGTNALYTAEEVVPTSSSPMPTPTESSTPSAGVGLKAVLLLTLSLFVLAVFA